MTDPYDTMRRLAAHPRVPWALVLLVLVSIVHGVDASMRWATGRQWLGVFAEDPPDGAFDPTVALIVPPLLVAAHLLIVGGLRGVAHLLGGRGSYRGLLSAYAFALIPSILSPLGLLPGALAWLGTFAAFWALMLVVVAVQQSQRLSLSRAWAVIAIPGSVPGLVVLGVLLVSSG